MRDNDNTTKHYVHKVYSHCAWAGDHQAAVETYITKSEDTRFISVDNDITAYVKETVEVDSGDIEVLLKYIKMLTPNKDDTCEINGLDIQREYAEEDFW